MCTPLRELATLLKSKIKSKKMHRILEFNQSQWLKSYVEFNTQKRMESKKKKKKKRKEKGSKGGKALYKLINSVV